MSEMKYYQKLVISGKTVFTVLDLVKILGVDNDNYLRVLVTRMVARGELRRVTTGIYTCFNEYSIFELANKLKTPSYISLETVLFREGVIFQDYSKIVTSVSNNTLKRRVEGVSYEYFKIKDEVLSNPLGVEDEDGVAIATRERAAGDLVYLSPKFYFDRPERLDKEKMISLSKIYNLRVRKEVERLCLK